MSQVRRLTTHVVDQLHPQPSPEWLSVLRARLSNQLRGTALPGRREENWKYTSLARLENKSFEVALREATALAAEDLQPFIIPGLNCHRLVFVNGHFAAELSYLDELPRGLRITNLAGAEIDVMDGLRSLLEHEFGRGPQDTMANLNTAALADGLILEVGSGVTIERPIHCLFLTLDGDVDLVCSLRNVVRAGRGASVKLIEHFAGLGESTHLSNVVNQFELSEQASVEHIRIQQQSKVGYLITRQETRQQNDSTYRYFGFDLGGLLVRHDLNVSLAGENAHCELNGAYALDGASHVDNHSRVDHLVANASSSEFFKGILDGRSRAVFNGKVVVHEGADGTDASQANNNLLLSKLAEVDTKPELEIYADDVKCAHGVTVGQLDETQLFYLRSRGIPEAEARLLLTYAFCREIVDTVEDEALREFISALVVEHLPRAEALADVA